MARDFLDQKREEIAARRSELEPLVAEYERLQAAASALDAIAADPTPSRRARPGRSRSTRPRGRKAPSSGARGEPAKGNGKRAEQALEVITDHPGITLADLAEKMGIKQNYLYRVLPRLVEERRVRKEDGGWHPEHGA